MDDVVRALIQGFPVGCVYALVAAGLVLTFKTSGVFNLALGAQAFVSAAVFYDTRRSHEWPLVPALVLAVVIVGPLLGFVLDRAVYRFLRNAPPLAKLVTALGLLVGIPEIVKVWFGTGTKTDPPSVSPFTHVFRIGTSSFNADQLTVVVVSIAVVGALAMLFRFTRLGLRMRAVVESHRLVELMGIQAEKVSTTAWMLSGVLAGLAGVLLAPLLRAVDSGTFTSLVVAAIAAAAFGRLSSLPLTLAGGVLLGVVQQLVPTFLSPDTTLAKAVRPSIPFVMLFVVLLAWPGLARRREAADPLSGVEPPPPALAVTYRDERLARFSRYLFVGFLAAVLVLTTFVLSTYWVGLLTQGIIYTTVFLSITVVTGLGGQISLCQSVFAGVGAFTAGQLVAQFDMSFLAAMALGALLAAAVGVVVSLPALRLGGIYLALATLAFALMVENVFFPLSWVSGGHTAIDVPRPLVAGIDFTDDRSFFLLCFAVFALCGAVVVLVRKGTTGQYLAALRGSEVAATSIGISPVRAKVTVFAISAAIAGAGGALLASYNWQASASAGSDFTAFVGLFWVVLVATLSARTVDGAVNAGMAFVLFPVVLEKIGVPSSLIVPIQFAGFGFGAITFAKHPEGVVEYQKRRWIERMNPRFAA